VIGSAEVLVASTQVRGQHGVELAGDLGLDGAVLEHGLDHHVGVAQQAVVGAGRDAREDGVALSAAMRPRSTCLASAFSA
jgi:hypothetical protein